MKCSKISALANKERLENSCFFVLLEIYCNGFICQVRLFKQFIVKMLKNTTDYVKMVYIFVILNREIRN